ncbi:CSD-domain-containing protein [Cystobasidium minutum MCA 4210]|uniref:CSD-domain-containing protein n=1 Tax=Cystobasidium minutum MCA 4210 TaxID=1397322 RepID=UPI0034CFB300|eukprot:jgi/Rhomi1/170703/fgenesh1_kg.4_\
MTSLESTSSHLSARMSNPQGSLLSGKPSVNGNGGQHHLSSHQPASSSSSSSASIFDAFAPLPGGPPSAQAGNNNGHHNSSNNGASNNGASQSSGHRHSASMNLPASLKSPVVGGPSSTSPSAASAYDALANQFANASLGPNSVPSSQRVQSMNEHQSISPIPHYAQHAYPGHPAHRGHAAHHPGYHPHPRHSSQQPHHNPNPAVSTMWPRRHGVVKFFNSTKGFGFIWDNMPNEIGDVDIFIHWTTIQGDAQFKTLAEGEMVEYELGRGPKGFQALNVTGPNGANVQGDPLARLPVSLARNRMMPPSRYNPMGMPMPLGPMMMPGYPHHALPAQALDHGYASNPYLARAGYAHPPPAAYYAMAGAPMHSGVSSGSTTASHTPISSFGSTPASASTNSSLRNANGAAGSEASTATSATQHAHASQASANSAYAQYLAAANAHQRKMSYPGANGYENGHSANGFTDAAHANGPSSSFGAPGGGRNGSSRPSNGAHHSNEDLPSAADKANDSLGIFGGATPPVGWRN